MTSEEKREVKGNFELRPADIEELLAKLNAIVGKEKSKSLGLKFSEAEFREWREAEQVLRVEESTRKNKLNRAIIYDLKKAIKLRNTLARFVTKITAYQLAVTNLVMATMFGWQVFKNHQMPSDKAVLGWLASTIVEVIGLYAVVLRGVFTPSSIREVYRQ